MHTYQNKSGNSGVLAYEIFDHAIHIEFTDGGIYRYSYEKPGPMAVEKMKKLARDGSGLATYINQHVREEYEQRI
jgi:hypothetical protein